MRTAHPFRRLSWLHLLAALSTAAIALPAAAQSHHGGGGGHGGYGHGGYGHGGRGYYGGHYGSGYGGGGRWVHDHHGGRLGWWWVAGGLWYLTPPVVYVDSYPVESVAGPAVVEGSAPAPAPTWYFCDASHAYYPYVSTCPSGWRAVAATPPDIGTESPPPTPAAKPR